MRHERLFLEEVDDVLDLCAHAADHRVERKDVRPRETTSWNRPSEV